MSSTMYSGIQPADVYQRVNELHAVVSWNYLMLGMLCVLVVIQIITSVVVFTRFYFAQDAFLARAEQLIRLTETHGAVTDRTVRAATSEVTAEVRQAAAEVKVEVPTAVVEEIVRAIPPPPPPWRPTDPDRRVTTTVATTPPGTGPA